MTPVFFPFCQRAGVSTICEMKQSRCSERSESQEEEVGCKEKETEKEKERKRKGKRKKEKERKERKREGKGKEKEKESKKPFGQAPQRPAPLQPWFLRCTR